MNLFQNLAKEHVVAAIEKLDSDGLGEFPDSRYYDVLFEGKRYPPKPIMAIAYELANGNSITTTEFEGGQGTPAFKRLEELGFEIVEKITDKGSRNSSFGDQLNKFLDQAHTDNLKTKSYIDSYKNLKVKVSFGQGAKARIPWISFLGINQTTSHGIYPVYLYYVDDGLLILAYGISETEKPQINWQLDGEETIADFFKKTGKKPDRYGDSYIYRIYDIKHLPGAEVLDTELNQLLSQYKQRLESGSAKGFSVGSQLKFDIIFFEEAVKKAGLIFSPLLLKRFVASLITKPFAILTGLSGSGKTKLAQCFVQWICQEKSQYAIVPVGADWTNREPLLGYPNALKPEEYVKPDSDVLDLILQANKQPDLPHFLILDEMNLSHVERYFADFLSVMESKEEIPLFPEGTVENGVPARLKVPASLFIIGTVNIDETTNMFSPKVLDRANTIEFRVTKEEMENFLGNIKDISMDALSGKGAGMAKSFLEMAASKEFATADIVDINDALVQFFGELKKTGAEFGYRSATEIVRLIHQLSALDDKLKTNQKIDIAIMQKLLPKLHGSRRKLCPVLETLGSFCISGDIKIIKDIFEKPDFDFNATSVLYPLSLEKISRMYRGAIDNGFASFAEA